MNFWLWAAAPVGMEVSKDPSRPHHLPSYRLWTSAFRDLQRDLHPIRGSEAVTRSLLVLTQTPQLFVPSSILSSASLLEKPPSPPPPAAATSSSARSCNSLFGLSPFPKVWVLELLSLSPAVPASSSRTPMPSHCLSSLALLLSKVVSTLSFGYIGKPTAITFQGHAENRRVPCYNIQTINSLLSPAPPWKIMPTGSSTFPFNPKVWAWCPDSQRCSPSEGCPTWACFHLPDLFSRRQHHFLGHILPYSMCLLLRAFLSYHNQTHLSLNPQSHNLSIFPTPFVLPDFLPLGPGAP